MEERTRLALSAHYAPGVSVRSLSIYLEILSGQYVLPLAMSKSVHLFNENVTSREKAIQEE